MKGTPEAEKVGQTVLASQFVAGLRPNLQVKVVGMEGGMDQLVPRARFEEAKSKELAAARASSKSSNKGNPPGSGASASAVPRTGSPKTNPPSQTSAQGEGSARKCFNCGLEGHLIRACPYPKTKKDTKAKGRKEGTVTAIHEAETPEHRVEKLRRSLREAEMKIAVGQTSGVLRNVSTACDGRPHLGPVDVEVNGVKTTALVDTGSPATIISLDFVLHILADKRDRSLTSAQWRESTLRKFFALDVSLKSYGGHRVDILSQIPLQMKLDNKCAEAVVLVQKEAPNQLLLGTDVQPKLGIALVVKEIDLLTQEPF
jgi:hypothetical protein